MTTHLAGSDAPTDVNDLVVVLWRARLFIVIGALAAATFAFLRTPLPTPSFAGEVLLIRANVDAGPSSQATMVGQANQSGLELRVPVSTAVLPSLDAATLERLLKGTRLSMIAERIGGGLAARGLTPEALANQFSLTEVPTSRLVTVTARMADADLARKAADAIAAAAIEEEREMRNQDLDSALQQLQAQLKALDGMPAQKLGGEPPSFDPRALAEVQKLMYTGLFTRYQQLSAERTANIDGLRLARPAIVAADIATSARRLNAIVAFIAGALLVSVAAIALAYGAMDKRSGWRASR